MSDEHGRRTGRGRHVAGHGGGSHEEHEGAPEWLISFADNTALMMGFFVILLAMSMLKPTGAGEGTGPPDQAVPSDRMLDTAIAIRAAFHNPVDLGSADPRDLPLIRRILERGGDSETLQIGQKGREHDVRSPRPSQFFGTVGSVAFDTNQSEMTSAARESLEPLLPHLRGHHFILDIRGHASAAEAYGKPDRAVQLSYERALEVARALAAEGVSWRQMRLVACADNDRIVPQAYNNGENLDNQRVEIVETDQIIDERYAPNPDR